MIDKIIQNERQCTGCTACFNACPKIAIDMKLIDGFYKPIINVNKCVSCGKCISICPQNTILNDNSIQSIAFACKNKDDNVRMKSSSGGVFSLLAEQILNKGGIVYGAAFDRCFHVHHIRVDSVNELDKLRRSKYAQSNLGDTFQKIYNDLKSNRYVLFSGTPCQCNGLKNFLGKHKDIEKIYIVEVLCHGTPSPKIWENYLEYRIKKNKSQSYPITICFKSKDCVAKANWNNSYMQIRFNSDTYCMDSNYDPFMMLFARANVILNNACYSCQYRRIINRTYCDLSLSDFWGVKNFSQQFDDNKGCSLVLCHSLKGKYLLQLSRENMDMINVDPLSAIKCNGSFNNPKFYKMDLKIKEQLYENADCFGKTYIKYLPIIFIRKILEKIQKLVKKKQNEHQ